MIKLCQTMAASLLCQVTVNISLPLPPQQTGYSTTITLDGRHLTAQTDPGMEARYTRLVQEEEEGSGHSVTGCMKS